jgi:hypothetical protein
MDPGSSNSTGVIHRPALSRLPISIPPNFVTSRPLATATSTSGSTCGAGRLTTSTGPFRSPRQVSRPGEEIVKIGGFAFTTVHSAPPPRTTQPFLTSLQSVTARPR